MKFDWNDPAFRYIVYAVVAIVAFLLILRIIWKLTRICRALSHTTMEIRRSQGAERKEWKKKRKRVWLALIPFVPVKY